MAQPTAASALNSPSHSMLHRDRLNVLAFNDDANDGVTDATSAINAAVEQAFAVASDTSGLIEVFFPAGEYLISSAISLETEDYTSIRFVGAGGTNPGRRSTVIKGNFSGPLIQRTTSASQVLIGFEDLMFYNTHATGEGIKLSGIEPPSSVNRCYFTANRGISLIDNVHSTTVSNSKFTNVNSGCPAGSWGIYHGGHGALFNSDIAGFEHGIRVSGSGINISGGRYEVNKVGILLGQKEDGTNWASSGINVIGARGEGNDRFIWAYNVQGGLIGGVSNQGSAAAPSGQSIHGIDISGTYALTIAGAVMGGSYSGYPFDQTTGSTNISFLSCYADAAWNLSTSNIGLAVINCTPEVTRIEHPIIATASLPAAAAAQNGRVIIEDGGAGDRNLIVYAGGQRFRIDGGAAF